MRFLVDTNLPPALVAMLTSLGHDALHTSAAGLEAATDRSIWQYARSEDRCVISKDEDFTLLKLADPSGPRVVWVRVGNAVRRVLLVKIGAVWPQVVARLEAGDGIVEVR